MKPQLLLLPLALVMFGAGCDPASRISQPASSESQKPTVNTQADTMLAMQKYTDDSFGFAFSYPAEWKLDTSDGLLFRDLGPSKGGGEGDRISIRRVEGREARVDDAKFGPTRLYFDDLGKQWMIEQESDSATTSTPVAKPAVPAYTTLSGLPVFHSTGRWKTVIIPLSQQRFLVVNVTGSGWTTGLDPFVKTIRKDTETLKPADLTAAVQAMLDSEKPTN